MRHARAARRYRLAVHSGQPPVVEPWLQQALAAALADAGCPPGVAQQLSGNVHVERPRGSAEWLLVLTDHGTSYPATRDEAAYAVEHLARSVAADNAEAVDRAARGEPGWTPYWPLPDRTQRGQ